MSIVLSVAPPDGWSSMPDAAQDKLFTKQSAARRSLGSSDDYDLFRVTVLFQLEGGQIGGRFTVFDELNWKKNFLESTDIRLLLKELEVIEMEVSPLGLDEIVSARNFSRRLNLDLPPRDLMRQVTEEWGRVLSGQTQLSTLDPDEIDLQKRLFRASFKKRKLDGALDLFRDIFAVYRFMADRAIRRGRGLVLS